MSMTKWEYKTVKFDFNDFFISGNFDEKKFSNDINYYGWEGWELINSFDTNTHQGGTRFVICIFKREAPIELEDSGLA